MTGSLLSPFVEVVPSRAATMIEAVGNGDCMPVAVPRSSVAKGYEIESPQQELPIQ